MHYGFVMCLRLIKLLKKQRVDLPFDIFKIEHNNIVPQQGRILISDPFLADAYFKRSVVLLTEHNEKGTVGFVLNKPVEVAVNEILAGFPEMDTSISVGGPVGTNAVHYIHTLGEVIPESVKVTGNIWWGGDFDVVKDLIRVGKLNRDNIRFFVGYSGWEPKQLDREISESSWLVSELDSNLIMNSRDKDFWKEVLISMGGRYKLWTNFPENPGMN
jgi:putative transcriptional regulator